MVGQGEWNKASWRKSVRCGSDNKAGDCVCVAVIGSWGAIRDSKNPKPTTIVMPKSALGKLFDTVKRGRLDLH
ncbi:DUF397 domain-containing protein [Actinomadura keratinilytica]|jgi:hypothetical protein|uniref:DUF397 domain-containing protein n=1 Tax=Actinomadura keratinilytica TaxID=547461 RepID=A0ABP7YDW7_9ACTN